MKTIATVAAGAVALALLFGFMLLALVEVIFRGRKALDCGLEEEPRTED